MERSSCGRDLALSARMAVTMALLGISYMIVLAFPLWLFSKGILPWHYAFGVDAVVAVLYVAQYVALDRAALVAARARYVGADDAPQFHRVVDRLCGLADVPKPRLAVVGSDVPNAFATGRNPERSTVVITRGLVRTLEPEEIEAVLAHELSHVANRDGAVMTFASFPALTIGEGLARAPLKAWLLGLPFMLLACLAWLASSGLMLTISRCREYAADRGSALITGAPEQLMSALQKIEATVSRIPQTDLRQVQGVSALFIIPTKLRAYTHPSVERRLARLGEIAADLGRPEPPSEQLASGPSTTVANAVVGVATFLTISSAVVAVGLLLLR
jgi:heat shock protein HtpX